MSVIKARTETECHQCGNTYEYGYDGQYCSQECFLASKGEKALNNIRHDHRFCSTCYRPLKVVYRPDDQDTPELRKKALVIRESFAGFQDFTEYAESGAHGLECVCGNVDHYHSEGFIRDSEPYEWFLKLAIAKFRDEGQVDYTFDITEFSNAYWETDNFEYAVGKAIKC